jgi:hypothetical protein
VDVVPDIVYSLVYLQVTSFAITLILQGLNMDATQDIAQVALPTDVINSTDLKVEVVSMDFANGTKIMV